MFVGEADFGVVGVEEGAIGGNEARPADRPERGLSSLGRREAAEPAIRRHRETDRGAVEVCGVKAVGPDLPAGIGNVE